MAVFMCDHIVDNGFMCVPVALIKKRTADNEQIIHVWSFDNRS